MKTIDSKKYTTTMGDLNKNSTFKNVVAANYLATVHTPALNNGLFFGYCPGSIPKPIT